MPDSPKIFSRAKILLCLLLAVSTFAVYSRALHYPFIGTDDPDYVTKNLVVRRGLTQEGIIWAFTQRHSSNWHPLTWLSHMLDCQIFGSNAGGHHAVNVALHSAGAALLFLLLTQMTGAKWRSAVVAGLFALHPLRVESVAWIAERKDVLSGLFFM